MPIGYYTYRAAGVELTHHGRSSKMPPNMVAAMARQLTVTSVYATYTELSLSRALMACAPFSMSGASATASPARPSCVDAGEPVSHDRPKRSIRCAATVRKTKQRTRRDGVCRESIVTPALAACSRASGSRFFRALPWAVSMHNLEGTTARVDDPTLMRTLVT